MPCTNRCPLLMTPLIAVLLVVSSVGYSSVDISAFTFIDIRPAANRGFYDETAGDSVGGWADFGPDACFKKIPFGVQVFQDGVIPFSIIDPATNDGKSVIVLSGPKREELFPKQSQEIPVGGAFSELYFLHTAMYPIDSQEPMPIIRYHIGYADGTEHLFECRRNIEMDDWWDPHDHMPAGLRTYRERQTWLIITPWKNPHPDKPIAWIRMASAQNAIPILVAITAANNPAAFDSLAAKIDEQIRRYEQGALKIALVQPAAETEPAVNLKRGDDFVRRAKAMDADIVVFPEMFSVGYFLDIDFDDPNAVQRWKDMAVDADSPFVTHFQQLAKELELAILITYLEDRGGTLRNTAALFDRNGRHVLTYSKVHTCDFGGMEASVEPGDDFYVAPLDTPAGPVQTGVMICYDREFPESARILMLKGAELILTPNACGLDYFRLTQFQIRAWENSLATAMANYAAGPGNGRSCAFNADGKEIITAPADQEGIFIAEIDVPRIQKIREQTFWGNAFRRPRKYKLLLSPEVNEPFIRNNAFDQPFDRLKR